MSAASVEENETFILIITSMEWHGIMKMLAKLMPTDDGLPPERGKVN